MGGSVFLTRMECSGRGASRFRTRGSDGVMRGWTLASFAITESGGRFARGTPKDHAEHAAVPETGGGGARKFQIGLAQECFGVFDAGRLHDLAHGAADAPAEAALEGAAAGPHKGGTLGHPVVIAQHAGDIHARVGPGNTDHAPARHRPRREGSPRRETRSIFWLVRAVRRCKMGRLKVRRVAAVPRFIPVHQSPMLSARENELRFEVSMRAADHVWWEWFPASGRMILESAGACVLGYDLVDGVMHRDYWVERLHPDDAPRVLASLDQHLRGETDFWRVEHRFRAREGNWIWVEEYGKVRERSPSGEAERLVGIMRQVHDDHFLARLFSEADDTVKGLCDALPLAFWLRDGEGRVTLASRPASGRWPDLRGSRPVDLAADAEEAARWHAVISDVVATGASRTHVRRLRDGEQIVAIPLETCSLTSRTGMVTVLEWMVAH